MYIQCPPLLLAPLVKMSKKGYKKFTIWLITLISH